MTNKLITSTQNALIKQVVLLKEKSRERKKSDLFIIEGIREIELAIKGNYQIKTLLFYAELFSTESLNTFNLNGKTYTSVGIYMDTVFTQNTSNGCDSVITLDLRMKSNCTVDTSACAELFFSEYTEGSVDNKALEIYNPTNAPVSLSGYSVQIFQNGGLFPGVTIGLVGTINPKDVHVITHTNALQPFLDKADQTDVDLNFNGNDAIVLFKGTDTYEYGGPRKSDDIVKWVKDKCN